MAEIPLHIDVKRPADQLRYSGLVELDNLRLIKHNSHLNPSLHLCTSESVNELKELSRFGFVFFLMQNTYSKSVVGRKSD